MGGLLEGWRVASKGLGALPRIRRGALGRVCGREGGRALPLPRAAAVWTGLRVRQLERDVDEEHELRHGGAQHGARLELVDDHRPAEAARDVHHLPVAEGRPP